MQSLTRTPFTLADGARIQGGAIVATHDNWCKSLATGFAADCVCAELDYRIVRPAAKAQAQR